MISCSVVDCIFPGYSGDRQAGMFGIPIQLGVSHINNACVTQLLVLWLPKSVRTALFPILPFSFFKWIKK